VTASVRRIARYSHSVCYAVERRYRLPAQNGGQNYDALVLSQYGHARRFRKSGCGAVLPRDHSLAAAAQLRGRTATAAAAAAASVTCLAAMSSVPIPGNRETGLQVAANNKSIVYRGDYSPCESAARSCQWAGCWAPWVLCPLKFEGRTALWAAAMPPRPPRGLFQERTSLPVGSL
jgi:hypothetical protein